MRRISADGALPTVAALLAIYIQRTIYITSQTAREVVVNAVATEKEITKSGKGRNFLQSEKGSHTTLHAHGDNTYHSVDANGNRKDHLTFGAAIMHMAKMHGPPGDHMHVHGHEEGFTTHHVMEGERVRGPEEHGTAKQLAAHVATTMDTGQDSE